MYSVLILALDAPKTSSFDAADDELLYSSLMKPDRDLTHEATDKC